MERISHLVLHHSVLQKRCFPILLLRCSLVLQLKCCPVLKLKRSSVLQLRCSAVLQMRYLIVPFVLSISDPFKRKNFLWKSMFHKQNCRKKNFSQRKQENTPRSQIITHMIFVWMPRAQIIKVIQGNCSRIKHSVVNPLEILSHTSETRIYILILTRREFQIHLHEMIR